MLIRVYMDSAPSFSISRSPRKNRVWLVKSIFLHHFILPHQKPPIHPGIAEPNQRYQRYQEKLTYHLKKTAILIVVFGDMNRTLTGCVFFFSKNSRTNQHAMTRAPRLTLPSHVGHKALGLYPKNLQCPADFCQAMKRFGNFPPF